ncbi:Teichoic acid biosynthesis protein C (Precursor) [Streptomyces dysideae]|uniref:Teichoic acid biosynthesis protein C (Precursor) n=1 Tax=Streptomyces dysideae TaxID=909626 RepID=UPI001F2174E7|nr:Teichoic acid biosynthesis protein C (Precursor) [Streptomyces dysideae]
MQHGTDGKVWIWTECAAGDSGYGRGVTRFRFANGATRQVDDVKVRFPIPGSTGNQPSVCQATNRIAIRHRVKNVPRYRIYDLDSFVAGDYTNPVADFAQTGVHPDPAVPFQGYALHGDHLYQLAGTQYDPVTNPPAERGNTYVSCLGIRTGKLIQRLRTEAGHSLEYREPEGMAVRVTPKPRLCMGFASGTLGARRFSVYDKPRG